jgi:hypothetical protein
MEFNCLNCNNNEERLTIHKYKNCKNYNLDYESSDDSEEEESFNCMITHDDEESYGICKKCKIIYCICPDCDILCKYVGNVGQTHEGQWYRFKNKDKIPKDMEKYCEILPNGMYFLKWIPRSDKDDEYIAFLESLSKDDMCYYYAKDKNLYYADFFYCNDKMLSPDNEWKHNEKYRSQFYTRDNYKNLLNPGNIWECEKCDKNILSGAGD